MSAAFIAATLGGASREGRDWRCRCPIHGGRSLMLRDGDNGKLLFNCWGGCDHREIWRELDRRGLLENHDYDFRPDSSTTDRHSDPVRDARRSAWALSIWSAAVPAANTIVATHFTRRSIELDTWPPSLRFLPQCPRPRDGAGNLVSPLPAMVALVEHVERGPVAVHVTYLSADGCGKADIPNPKVMFGPVTGAVIRLSGAQSNTALGVAEGIETSLSVRQIFQCQVWAALSASGIKNFPIIGGLKHLTIFADHDDAGLNAARECHDRYVKAGIEVEVRCPPEARTDWNDYLRENNHDYHRR